MTGENPLIAERKDSTTAYSGIGIAESAVDIYNGVKNGSWLEAGLGVAGGGLEVLSLALDPVGTLLSYGVAWLMEHVKPLSDALDWLAGDADQIAAYAQTWKNVAKATGEVAESFVAEVNSGTAGWTGAAADAYRAAAAQQADKIKAAATSAETIGTTVEMVGMLVGTVREVVRDLVADCVATLIARIPQWLAEIGGTFGAATPHVVASAASLISKWVNRITELITKLVRSLEKLSPILKRLDEIWAALKKALPGRGSRGTPSSPDTVSTPTSPTSTPNGTSTSPSSTTNPTSTTPTRPPDTNPTSPSDGTSTSPSSTTTTSTPPSTSTTSRNGPRGSDGSGSSSSPTSSSTSTSPSSTRPDGPSRSSSRPDDPHNTSKPVDGRRCKGDPIDVVSGEMVLRQTDVELPGVLPLVLARTHVSSYRSGRSFGHTWSSTLDQRLEIDDAGVVFVADEGVVLVYPTPAPGASVLPEAGARWPLTRTDTGFTVTDPERGHTWHFASSGGNELPLLAITDRNGNRIDLDRAADGTPLGLRHSGGYRIGVDTTDGLVTALRLVGANGGDDLVLVRYGYDEEGRLTEVINSSGQPLRFTYDPAGRITGWQDRNGFEYRYVYDAQGRCVRTEGTGGFLSSTFDYDPANRVTLVTNSLGHVTRFEYNERKQVVREVDPLGNATVSEWDPHDRLLSYTDPLGHTTRYRYDKVGNLVAITRPDNSQVLVEYNALRLPVTVVGPDGAVWRQEYDERGNLTAVTDPLGATTRYTYDERGGLRSVTDALGNTSWVETNSAGLPVAVTDPLGATTRYTQDALGRVVEIVDPLGGVTQLAWTVEGRPTQQTKPDGATTRWRYDGEGNLVEFVDERGQVTRTEYTIFDLPVAQVGPDGARVELAYDTELRLIAVTNPQGLVWRYEYDPAGNLVRETDFNGRVLTYTYDAAGRLVERTNGAGETVRFVRDPLGNIVERHVGGAVTRFSLDPAGRLVHAVGPDAELVIERDALGRVLAETCNGRTVRSVYDTLGRRIRRYTPSGAESVWEYDAAGRPVTLTSSGQTVRFGYDAVGRETERHLGPGAVLLQTWDVNHRLRTQTLTAVGLPAVGATSGRSGQVRQARVLQRRSYVYRADGYVTDVVDLLAGHRRFDLDVVGRVTAVHGTGWTERYAYDPTGNIVHAGWPAPPGADLPDVDARGEREYAGTLIRRAGNIRYQHDAQGRVVLRQQKRLSAKPRTWHYTWDAEDRLVGVVTPDGTRWRYRYDPLGRRIAKQRLAADGATVVEQVDFTWDGVVLAEQAHTVLGPQGSVGPWVTAWDWEPGSFRPVTQVEGAPLRHAPQEWVDRRFYAIVTDLVGTPSELVEPDGNIAWHARSTLWGASQPTPLGRAWCPLRFPGQYFDPETGLHYNFFRYYDPVVGCYTSNDPLGLTPGPNPRMYVANPTVGFDPLGLTSCDSCNSNSDKLPKGDNRWYQNRREAFNAAKDRAGIPRSASPLKQWVIGGDVKKMGQEKYYFDANPGRHGRYYVYRVNNSFKIIAEHTNDPRAPHPHFHAYQPKTKVDKIEDIDPHDRFQAVGDKHHYYYGAHSPSWPGDD